MRVDVDHPLDASLEARDGRVRRRQRALNCLRTGKKVFVAFFFLPSRRARRGSSPYLEGLANSDIPQGKKRNSTAFDMLFVSDEERGCQNNVLIAMTTIVSKLSPSASSAEAASVEWRPP